MKLIVCTARRHLISTTILFLSIILIFIVLLVNIGGNTAKADINCGSKPSLSLSNSQTYWASYSDYLARNLSVDYSILNNSSGDANSVRVIGANSTNSVSLNSVLPLTIGSIPANSSITFTLQFTVPTGISAFRSTVFAQANDSCGSLYGYPSSIALGQPFLSNDIIYLDQPQDSNISIAVPRDLGADSFTVNLVRTDDVGNDIADEGQLNDDGSGNGTYTITKSFTSSSEETIHYHVVLKTSNSALVSDPFSIYFVKRENPVTFSAGQDEYLASQEIGDQGGTIELTNGPPSIRGAKINFPPGALFQSENVTVGYNLGNMNPNEGTSPGLALTLDTGTEKEFNQPVTITLPLPQVDTVPVPYYVDGQGNLEPTQLVDIDTAGGTFSFQTTHASIFSWILNSISGTAYAPSAIGTNFNPHSNGFQIVNGSWTSPPNKAGNCLGMTSFASWYFTSMDGVSPLYSRFMNSDYWGGSSVAGQAIIADLAQTEVTAKISPFNAAMETAHQISQEQQYIMIESIIRDTGQPVLILLSNREKLNDPVSDPWQLFIKREFYSGIEGAHSVLAYRSYGDGTMMVYDPNYPDDPTRKIHYNKDTHSFDPYYTGGFNLLEKYESVSYMGTGYSHFGQSFSKILSCADDNFVGCDFNSSGSQGSGTVTQITDHLRHWAMYSHDPQISDSGQIVFPSTIDWPSDINLYTPGSSEILFIGGGAGVTEPQINKNGHVAFGRYDYPSGKWAIDYYDGGSPNCWGCSQEITGLINLSGGPAINSSDQVAWGSDNQIFIYTPGSGTETISAGGTFQQFNDQGQVVWKNNNNDIFLYTPSIGASQITSGNSGGNSYPQLNNNGQVTWFEWNGTVWVIYLYTPGSGTVQLTSSSGGYFFGQLQINDHGQVVWPQLNGSTWQVYMYTLGSGIFELPYSTSQRAPEPQLNNNGQVVWVVGDGDYSYSQSDIFLYTPGQGTAQLTQTPYREVHPDINSSGSVAWMGNINNNWEIFLYSP